MGIPDIEVLGIFKITCKIIDGQQTGRKFDSHIIWPAKVPKCKTHMVDDHRTDSRDANQSNVNILYSFRSSVNKKSDS